MPYRLSALAERDLEEIWSYVAEDASPSTADRLIDAIIDRFDLLVKQPRMGRARPEFGPGVRSFSVEGYVVYYRHEDELLVARVLHGRRDQTAEWSQPGPVSQ
jgi:toxin ParE1/3/4